MAIIIQNIIPKQELNVSKKSIDNLTNYFNTNYKDIIIKCYYSIISPFQDANILTTKITQGLFDNHNINLPQGEIKKLKSLIILLRKEVGLSRERYESAKGTYLETIKVINNFKK